MKDQEEQEKYIQLNTDSKFEDDSQPMIKTTEDKLSTKLETLSESDGSKRVSVFKLQFSLLTRMELIIVILGIIFSSCLGVSSIFIFYIVGNTINELIPTKQPDLKSIKKDFVFTLVCGNIIFLVALCHCFIWYYNGKKLALRYKKEYFKLIMMQEQTWFDRINVYELSSKVEAQSRSIEQGVKIY